MYITKNDALSTSSYSTRSVIEMDFDEDPNYLDLDDILAQTQTVNCRFLLNIPGLEFLAPGSGQEATQGSELLLPFWMAKTLYTYSMIDIDLPKAYNAHFREILSADADVVDLHRAGPHYYRFGKLLMELRRDKGNNLEMFTEEGQRNKYRREEGETLEDKRSIAVSLINTFHHRRHKLLEYSTNPAAGEDHREVRSFESRLDNMEKRLFQLGRKQVNEINKWKSRKIELIRNNMIATRLSKRRKLESSSTQTVNGISNP